MLRVMLSVLIVAQICPTKCQENTESIVETTSSRGTTGTIFNDLVDADFVGEGVTGFSGFIPDDTESVNTEGAQQLKDFIQTTRPRQNFTTFTTPVTLFQTENIVQDKESISEADDITSTNNYTDQYNIQTTNGLPSTIPYDERGITKTITDFTTKQTILSETSQDDLDNINFDYAYDDQIYSDQDDIISAIQQDVNTPLPIEDPPPTDNTSIREVTSQPTDERYLKKTSNDEETSYFSDASNKSDFINFDSVTVTEAITSTYTNALGQNTVHHPVNDEISEEYKENIISSTTQESIQSTTSKIIPEEVTYNSQLNNFPLDFDIEESIITIPSVLMEQITTKVDLTLENTEDNSFHNINYNTGDSETTASDGVLSTEKDESNEATKTVDYTQSTPINLIEDVTAGKTTINEEIDEFQDFETFEYNEMNGEKLDQNSYNTNVSTDKAPSSLELEELINGSTDDKNVLLSDRTTENVNVIDSSITVSTSLPFTTISKDSENSISDSIDLVTSTLKELSANETSTSTKINYVASSEFSEETTANTEKNNVVYPSTEVTEESTVVPISSLNPQILGQNEISTTTNILYSTFGSIETTTTEKNNVIIEEATVVPTTKNNVVYSSTEVTEESTVVPISSLNPQILGQNGISTTTSILYSTFGSIETTTTEKSNVIIEEATVVPTTPQNLKQSELSITSDILHLTGSIETTTMINTVHATEDNDFSEENFNEANTEDLSNISLEEISSTGTNSWEETSSDEFYDTTPLDNMETSIETTTNILHIWLAQESTKKNMERDDSFNLSEEHNEFSSTNTNFDETAQGGSTNSINDVTIKPTEGIFVESTAEITEHSTIFDKTGATFQTTSSTDDADDFTTNYTDSVSEEDILEKSESNTFKKLEGKTFETTTMGVVSLEIGEENFSEKVQEPTPFNTISTDSEAVEEYEFNGTDFTYFEITSVKNNENMLEITSETPYGHQKQITENFAMDRALETSTNNVVDAEDRKLEISTTEKVDLQNSVIDSTTHVASNEEDETSTIFSKELIDNGQFTADAINILKEDDYETTENVKLSVEDTDINENTEIPFLTITDENDYLFATLPPTEKFETADGFKKHLDIIEDATTESIPYGTTEYSNIDSNEHEEFTEGIVVNSMDDVSEASENRKSKKIYEKRTTDFLSTTSTIPSDITSAVYEEEGSSITTAIGVAHAIGVEEESEIVEIEEHEVINDLSREDDMEKINASQENVENDSTEKQIKETNTNLLLLENTPTDITKTISEESSEKDTDFDEDNFENETIAEEIVEDNISNGGSSEEDYKDDQDGNRAEEDQFQKDDIITTDTVISSMKELEELDNETLNHTNTAFKISDDLTTSINSLEDADSREILTRPKINNGEQELFSKYVFKTYIDRTTTERLEPDNRDILSTTYDFGNLLKGENVNALEHILTDRDAKVNISEEKVRDWKKLGFNELVEEEEGEEGEKEQDIIVNNQDEFENEKFSEDEIANETSENTYTDSASMNYYDEDYTNSEEFNNTDGIDSDDQNDSTTPYLTITSTGSNEFCIQGNISLRILIGEHGIDVSENSQVSVNCSHQIYNLVISWRGIDLETNNSTISISIEAGTKEYFIDSVEVIHIDNVEATKLIRRGLVLLTTPIDEIMTGSFTIDFENGYQLEVMDVNLRLNKVVEYSDSELASQAKPIISNMTIIIICTSVTSCLILLVTAIILYRKFTAKATIYKMSVE